MFNFELRIAKSKIKVNNSKLIIQKFKIGFADNSKFKTQNSKSALPTIQNSKFKTHNSKLIIQNSKMKNSTLNIQVATAVFMLIGGLALAVAGFIVPPLGQIHESVLGIFAECLIYAGSIFGVTVYIRTKYTEMKTYLDESLKKNEECGMWNEEWSAEPMKNEE